MMCLLVGIEIIKWFGQVKLQRMEVCSESSKSLMMSIYVLSQVSEVGTLYPWTFDLPLCLVSDYIPQYTCSRFNCTMYSIMNIYKTYLRHKQKKNLKPTRLNWVPQLTERWSHLWSTRWLKKKTNGLCQNWVLEHQQLNNFLIGLKAVHNGKEGEFHVEVEDTTEEPIHLLHSILIV